VDSDRLTTTQQQIAEQNIAVVIGGKATKRMNPRICVGKIRVNTVDRPMP
jgi:hypothetical protein